MSKRNNLLKKKARLALSEAIATMELEERMEFLIDAIIESSESYSDDINMVLNIAGNILSNTFINTGGLLMSEDEFAERLSTLKASDNPRDHAQDFVNIHLREISDHFNQAINKNFEYPTAIEAYKRARDSNFKKFESENSKELQSD